MGARAALRPALLLSVCVCLAYPPSRSRAADSFVVPTDRGRPRPLVLVGRAAAPGLGAELKQFVPPDKRIPGHSVLAFFRSLGLMLTMFCLSSLVVPTILAGLPVVKRKDPKSRKFVDRVICAWSQLTTWPFFSVKVKGRENLLPEEQAVVYVANHQSFMDILSCYHLWRSFKWVSKSSILKIPIVGWVMKRARTITIEREDRRSQMAAFRNCVSYLEEGTSIFIFPEGTRSLDGALLDFKKGPVSMAKRAKVPIVPVTILGTGRLMPSKKEFTLYHNRAGVEIIIHPAVPAQEVQDGPDRDVLLKLRQTIESALPLELQKGTIAS
ncbi:unnamed protein product [Symbiodinium natans]|uniref:1-acyl-sn-glycerol-3-phosphate acyltransferase n=1 Tax=Symbiodinium natans TaxID=878477 RepID=A0A812L320_9DINO|nr:unnamed protein product [Symbiodinium natans]